MDATAINKVTAARDGPGDTAYSPLPTLLATAVTGVCLAIAFVVGVADPFAAPSEARARPVRVAQEMRPLGPRQLTYYIVGSEEERERLLLLQSQAAMEQAGNGSVPHGAVIVRVVATAEDEVLVNREIADASQAYGQEGGFVDVVDTRGR